MALFEKQIGQILSGENDLVKQFATAEEQLLAKALLGAQALIDYALMQAKGLDINLKVTFDPHQVEKAKPPDPQ